MELDPVLLARLQFAFTVTFHIIFPTFTIGLSAYIATLMVLWVATGQDRYQRLARFWTRIFAVSFAMGVVSGIVLSYQFGTNWSRFSVFAGNIVGPLIGYEVLTAFFLEATFLGIMLFGWGRVPRWLQVFASIMVALGTMISAFWVLAANSWMHTPTGHEIVDGVAVPLDWWAIIFNPSFPYRLAHMLNASFLTAGFVVLAVGARYLLADRHPEQARTMMRMAIVLLAVLAPLQLLIGDLHGLNTLKHQPIKIAAMEAHWDSDKPGDFHIFAWPDEKAETQPLRALDPARRLVDPHPPAQRHCSSGSRTWPPQNRPPVKTVFFAFRIMLAVGFFMIAAALIGAWLLWRGMLFETRWYLRIVAHAWWTGFVAVIAGWVVTESGRQPWVVQGILRTADATSPVAAAAVAGDAGAVRHGLCHRVRDGHLLHQPADRAGAAGPRDRVARARARRGRWRPPTTPDARRWHAVPDPTGAALERHGMGSAVDLGRRDRHSRSRSTSSSTGSTSASASCFRSASDERERDQMIASIAPFWDGNETWLVLGGGGLWVAFPRAYAVIMPALYLPVIVMLLALVFRGVAFEFRHVAETSKRYWNVAFAGGSTLAALVPGRDPRRADPGHQGRERRLRRRRVRLGDAVCAAVRARRGGGLRAARRHLAGNEDRGRGRRARARAGQGAAARGARLHGGGEPVDAACVRADRRALVLDAEHLLSLAGAAS